MLTVLVSPHSLPRVRCSWYRIDCVFQGRKVHFALGCCLKWGGRAIFAHAFRYVDDENRSRYWVAIHRWNRRETPVTTDASVRGRLSEMCPKNPILLLHHVSWFRTSIGFSAGPTGYGTNKKRKGTERTNEQKQKSTPRCSPVLLIARCNLRVL